MRFRWWFHPLYIWSLLNVIIGLLFSLLFSPKNLRWRSGCLEITCTNLPMAAITWGWLILYRSEVIRDQRVVRLHERVHTVQQFYGGPLFLLAYVLTLGKPFEKHAIRVTAANHPDAWT